MTSKAETDTLSKISGVLLGVICGDLLGEQVESTPNTRIIKTFRTNAKYTDDTEMTLITLQHLMSFKTIKPLAMSIEYASNATWSRKYGGNMVKTLKKIKEQPHKWETAYKEFLEEGSWGNGCLMRIAPLALFDLNASREDLSQHLTDCLKSTHNNDESLQCSIEYCLILKELFQSPTNKIDHMKLVQNVIDRNLNARLTEKIQLIKDKILDTNSVEKYDQLSHFINHDLVEHGIRSSDTLALVIATLMYNCKYNQWTPTALLSIIVSFGGDTDTNASILGAFLGAIYSINWIAVDWFNNIENKTKILNQFQTFGKFLVKENRV